MPTSYADEFKREVWRLREHEGCTHLAIAQRMNCSGATVSRILKEDPPPDYVPPGGTQTLEAALVEAMVNVMQEVAAVRDEIRAGLDSVSGQLASLRRDTAAGAESHAAFLDRIEELQAHIDALDGQCRVTIPNAIKAIRPFPQPARLAPPVSRERD